MAQNLGEHGVFPDSMPPVVVELAAMSTAERAAAVASLEETYGRPKAVVGISEEVSHSPDELMEELCGELLCGATRILTAGE